MGKIRVVLLKVDRELRSDEIESLKFLCLSVIGRKSASTVTSGHELFEILENRNMISENSCSFLLRILATIGREDLCNLLKNDLGGAVQVDSNQDCYNNNDDCGSDFLFQEQLFKLSEELGPGDVSSLRFLYNSVPRKKRIESGIDLFSTLLEKDLIGPKNLDSLIDNLDEIGRKDLTHMLNIFKGRFLNDESAYETASKIPTMVSERTAPLALKEDEEDCKKMPAYYSCNIMDRPNSFSMNVSSEEYYNDTECKDIVQESCAMNAAGAAAPKDCLGKPVVNLMNRELEDNLENLTVHLSPCKASDSFFSAETLPRYKMSNNPRGICLVIDNQTFTKDPADKKAKELKHRGGSEKDSENIQKCFTTLKFCVRVEKNLSDEEMKSTFRKCASDKKENEKSDCFVVFILSHGSMDNNVNKPFVYGSNGRKVFVDDITSMFSADVCPSLWGKPKLFFLACCLGQAYPKAIPRPPHEATPTVQTDMVQPEEDETEELQNFVCGYQDFFIGYATGKGKVSFRDTQNGTWYIKELTEILTKHHEKVSFQHMVVLVNQAVAKNSHMFENDSVRYTQLPMPESSLIKQLWF